MVSLSEVIELGKTGKFTYPQLVNELIKAGVTHYSADVANRIITYFGKESFVEESPGGFLVISSTFNRDGVITAIKKTQRKETNYSQFLEEIAKAGIYKYDVNLIDRKIRYVAKDGFYEEQIPNF